MEHAVKQRSATDRLTALGLHLGPLEMDVMEVVWKLGPSSVRDVVDQMERRLAYTTVMTTLDRLYKKGILDREMTDRAFLYCARLSREEWNRSRAGAMLAGFLAGPEESRHILLSCLVDAVGTHDAMLLDELEKKIQRKREELAEKTR
jgi:predicted transcriptional regulator